MWLGARLVGQQGVGVGLGEDTDLLVVHTVRPQPQGLLAPCRIC